MLKKDTVTIYVTEYIRYLPVESLISITAGRQGSLFVEHIHSTVTLPFSPSIDLRQNAGAKLSFVTLVNGASST